MYNLSHFKEKDQKRIYDFIENHPFAFLTGSKLDGTQVATQVPILLVERNSEWFLHGHIMRNSDHHKALKENSNCLVVFTGAHTYVSARWYSEQHVGSTWNYMSVHINGNIQFLSDEQFVEFMKKLTLKFEGNDQNSPTYFDNLSEDYLSKMMKAIVGFEIKVEQLDNVFKLSQNKDESSYLAIISELEKQDDHAKNIATEMKKRYRELFN